VFPKIKSKNLYLIFTFCLAWNIPISAYSDISCDIYSNFKFSDQDSGDTLIIRDDISGPVAIMMTKYFTQMYTCRTDIVFEYECYGFRDSPFGSPTQLNITETTAGGMIISSALNLIFLQQYSKDQYASENKELRRFAVDTYSIKACKS
ncbi:hypothetical protein N9301_10660, partial [Paracoccaceae bacterium]|nr:hypothetical protein [Paracoccaceae bacterium]